MSSRVHCARRTEHRPDVKVELHSRDLVGLHTLWRVGVLTAETYAVLQGQSVEASRRRLRKLRHAGFVRALLQSLNEPTYYVLGRRALPELERVYGVDRDTVRLHRSLPRQLDHRLDVARTLIDIEVGATRSTRLTVEHEHTLIDGDMRPLPARRQRTHVPDLRVVVRLVGGGRIGALIEVDRATLSPRAMMRRIRAYAAAHASGERIADAPFVLLIRVPHARRRLILAKRLVADSVAPPDFVFIGTADEVTHETFFTKIWATVAPGQPPRLVRANPFNAAVGHPTGPSDGARGPERRMRA